MSYWMVALTPADLSARNRLAIASNVSFTVGISDPPFLRSRLNELVPPLEREQVHAAGHREDGARDVARALRAEEGDGIGDVLGLSLLLHRHALDHPRVHRGQRGVRSDDAGRDHVGRDVVPRAF